MSDLAERIRLIQQLRAVETAKQTLLRKLAERHMPPYEWLNECRVPSEPLGQETSLILYVGRRPAGHVWAGRRQLAKTPKITWEDSWFWRMVGQETATPCSSRADGMHAVMQIVNANKLAYCDPRDWLEEAQGG